MMQLPAPKRQPAPELETAIAAYTAVRSPEHLHRVVEAGTGLVYHFAGLYSHGSRRDDLSQAGYEGLIKAAQRFEPQRGVSFATYAGHCIVGEIRHYIRKEASFDRSGRVAELQILINEAIDEHFKSTGEVPSLAYIAEAVNVHEAGVVQALRAGSVPLEEVDLSKIQSLRYESFRLPIEDRIALEQAVNKLSSLQRRVIGLLYYRELTQEQAAVELGISQRKVSRLLHKSLNQLALCLAWQ